MTKAMYGKGRQAFGDAGINWSADTIMIQLIDTALYTPAIDTHQFLSDIPAAARIGAPVALTGKSNVLGVLDAADVAVTIAASPAAPTIEAAVIYKAAGTDATSPLIIWDDQATGFPVGAGATTVNLAFDSGANKIFKL